VLAQFASIFDTFEHSDVVAETFIEREGAVVVPSRWRGRLRGSEGVIEQQVVAVYSMRAGRIARISYHPNLDEALSTLAPPEPGATDPTHPGTGATPAGG
jgi:ketosteroid isomerase-like protein